MQNNASNGCRQVITGSTRGEKSRTEGFCFAGMTELAQVQLAEHTHWRFKQHHHRDKEKLGHNTISPDRHKHSSFTRKVQKRNSHGGFVCKEGLEFDAGSELGPMPDRRTGDEYEYENTKMRFCFQSEKLEQVELLACRQEVKLMD